MAANRKAEYGLLKWYPRAKDEGTHTTGKKKAKKKRGRPRKAAVSAPGKTAKAPPPPNADNDE